MSRDTLTNSDIFHLNTGKHSVPSGHMSHDPHTYIMNGGSQGSCDTTYADMNICHLVLITKQ